MLRTSVNRHATRHRYLNGLPLAPEFPHVRLLFQISCCSFSPLPPPRATFASLSAPRDLQSLRCAHPCSDWHSYVPNRLRERVSQAQIPLARGSCAEEPYIGRSVASFTAEGFTRTILGLGKPWLPACPDTSPGSNVT